MCSLNAEYIKKHELPFQNRSDGKILSPWLSSFIDELKKISDIELSIVSVYSTLKMDVVFREDGVSYFLLSQKMPFFNRGFPFIFKKLTKYRLLRRKVKKIIESIQPDIIHLHGSETDLGECYSDFTSKKMYSPLGIMAHQFNFSGGKFYKHLALREKIIVQKSEYIGIRANFMKQFFYSLNPDTKLYWHSYMMSWPSISFDNYPKKDADVIFVARIHRNKGIEDLINAIYIIKNEYNRDIKLKIIGAGGTTEYANHLRQLVSEFSLSFSVIFLGELLNHEDVFIEIAKSRLFVLPTHFDIIPGSLMEAMAIGTPAIAYSVGGIPDLNSRILTITLSEPHNVEALAKTIVDVLDNYDDKLTMAKNGSKFIRDTYDNKKILNELLFIYKEIYSNDIKYN